MSRLAARASLLPGRAVALRWLPVSSGLATLAELRRRAIKNKIPALPPQPLLLNEQQEGLLLHLFRVAGALSKRQLSELIDQGSLRPGLPSKRCVDRHVQHLTREGKLVVTRSPGVAGQFSLADAQVLPLVD
ncbi:hypothetical protein T492DRAFT_1109547 [Pavlovales sp. CCMP2436]|nr:hypothetical protein T492DRAFT_1109547 [Pavlovales sp. CCMP2436]